MARLDTLALGWHDGAMQSITETLKSFPIFDALSHEEAEEVARACVLTHLPAGHVLFREGDRGESVLLLIEGAVAVTRLSSRGATLQLGRVGAGSLLGEMSLIDPAPRSATATTISDTWVCEMKGSAFSALLDARHPAASRLLQRLSMALCERLREVVDRVEVELLDELADETTLNSEPPPSAAAPVTLHSPPSLGSALKAAAQSTDDDEQHTQRENLLRLLWG